MDSVAGMRIFTQVVEAGSFSAAARQLGSTPSSVSRQINDLEDSLGTRLFQRTTRNLSLTEAGELYFDRALSIINEVEEARRAISQLDGVPSGTLRLSVPGSFSRRHIIPTIINFQNQYPDVEVVLSASDQIIDMVENRIDLSIRVGHLNDSSLVARKLASNLRHVYASPAYLKKHGMPRCPEDLVNHNCMTFRSHPGSNLWKFKGPKGQCEVQATGNLFCNDAESLVAAAVEGHGIVLVPEWLASCEVENGVLKRILTKYVPVPKEVGIFALYPRQRYLAPKVRAFIDFCVERFVKTN